MSTLPQPPPDIDPPREIASFFRIGPDSLIFRSVCVAGTLVALADALQFRKLGEGLQSSILLVFGVMLLMVIAQGFLGLLFMAGKRRAPWRTILVLSPAILVSLVAIYGISTLFPHGRWARNNLERLLGGPVPPSVKNVTLDYHCNVFGATLWKFEFDLSTEDWEHITSYPRYEGTRSEGEKTPWGQVIPSRAFAKEGHYDLNYYEHRNRCTFTVASD